MAQRIALFYATKHGQTEKIARYIAGELGKQGCETTLTSLSKNPKALLQPSNYDGVILCAPIYARKYPLEMRRFLKRNRDRLFRSPKTGFISVCLTVTPNTREAYDESVFPLRELLDQVAWTPHWVASFPGALNYRKYNPVIRQIMKRISAREGGPTDTRRDHELTRWDDVLRMALDFAGNFPTSKFRGDLLHLATRRLNSLMPHFEQRIVHRIDIRKNVSQVREAMNRLEPSDMPLGELLARIRTIGQARQPSVPFFEGAERFGVVPIEASHREVIGGLMGQFWKRTFGIRRFPDAQSFINFNEDGYTKVLTSFWFESLPGKHPVTRVRTETRIHSLSADARARFALYWFLLGPGIRLYMRSMLRGLRRAAERPPALRTKPEKPRLKKAA